MGFNDHHNGSTQNPAARSYRWAGQIKTKVDLPDGKTAEQIEGGLIYFDPDKPEGEQKVRVKLPFEFCILEQSRSIKGFSPTPGTSIRYYSNEAPGYDDVLHVIRVDGSGRKEILSGKYSDIKQKLPQGAKLQINLYIFNPAEDRIEVLRLQGAAMTAFFEFSKANKGKLYERMCTLDTSGELKTTGSVSFVPPTFTLSAQKYSSDEQKFLVEHDKKVVDYLNQLRQQNGGTAVENSGSVKVDQTPDMYAGEENQETGELGDTIGLEEIPF